MSEPLPRGRWMPPVRSPLSLATVLASTGAWLTGGESARRDVERWVRGRWGPAQFALTDSGTTALAMAMRIATARAAGPVALPAWGCYDIATAADQAGVPFVFYDLDPASLGPAPDSVRAALGAGARSLVVAHFHGMPVDVAEVAALAGPGVMVIEDAAQGSGTELHGAVAGTVGHLGVLSFGRGKGITGGGGGALLVNDAALDEPFLAEAGELPGGGRGSLLGIGKLKAQWLLARPGLYALPAGLPFLGLGETTYRAAGRESGMSATVAGALAHATRLVGEELRARRRNVGVLSGLLEAVPAVQGIQPAPGCVPGWLRYPVLAPPGAWREDRRSRRLGIYPGYPIPLPRLPGFGARALERTGAMPGAERLARELVTLPVHGQVGRQDLEALVGRLRGALGAG